MSNKDSLFQYLQSIKSTHNFDTVKNLVENGADVNFNVGAMTVLGTVIKHKKLQLHRDQIRLVEYLLAQGANPNTNEDLLSYVVFTLNPKNAKEMMEMLLAYGANVTGPMIEHAFQQIHWDYWRRPHQRFTQSEWIDILKLLFEYADSDIKIDGQSLLCYF